MDFCIHCGGSNREDAVFCAHCGQHLFHATPHGQTEGALRRTRPRTVVIAIIVLFFLIAVLVLSLKNETNTVVSAPPKPAEPHLSTDPVVTIIGMDRSGKAVVQGSGFILTPTGLAATNYHVLKLAVTATAQCCGGQTFEVGTVEGVDFGRDLILFQLQAPTGRPQNLPTVVLGTSTSVSIGDRVTAVGSPEGLEGTVSDGIVSAIREDQAARYLQITAPISPGSSGGPVFDHAGRVVAVATAQLDAGQNLNFAIGAEYLRPLLQEHYSVSLSQFQAIVRGVQNKQRPASPASTDRKPEQPLTGQFGGVVHNTTADTSAQFGIIVDDAGGAMTGCMGVKQPLFGSGPLTGFRQGESVSFFVTSVIGELSFSGHMSGKDITGTYTVTHTDAPTESGTFTLHKINSKGVGRGFNTSQCPTDAEIH